MNKMLFKKSPPLKAREPIQDLVEKARAEYAERLLKLNEKVSEIPLRAHRTSGDIAESIDLTTPTKPPRVWSSTDDEMHPYHVKYSIRRKDWHEMFIGSGSEDVPIAFSEEAFATYKEALSRFYKLIEKYGLTLEDHHASI